MEIYLDANATTPVLPQAREAALAAMAEDFGNPSSIHSTGLKARAMMDGVRARARRVLGGGRRPAAVRQRRDRGHTDSRAVGPEARCAMRC